MGICQYFFVHGVGIEPAFFMLWRCCIKKGKKEKWFINKEIITKGFKEVMVIGPNGEQTGTKTIDDALTLAEFTGLDLVLLNANGKVPVCKIMDFNKFRYEKAKKAKDAKKRQKASIPDLKEFRLSVGIDVGDINTRLKQVRKYLEKGDHIKLSLRFRGREMAHTDLGREVLENFYKELEDIAQVEKKPKLEGRSMTMILTPKK